jgi:ribosomal protein S18 acetylase RimI-like enzyme
LIGAKKLLNNKLIIKEVITSDEKANIVEEILLDLPEWFGLPESTKDYIEQSKSLILFVAQDNQKNIGFITLKETSEAVCEIHCMGIKKEYHHKGIGTHLFNTFEEYAKEKYEFIQVKTVDEGHYKEYDQTLAFYKSVGFKKMEVFPKLWDEWNPCLILIKKI